MSNNVPQLFTIVFEHKFQYVNEYIIAYISDKVMNIYNISINSIINSIFTYINTIRKFTNKQNHVRICLENALSLQQCFMDKYEL